MPIDEFLHEVYLPVLQIPFSRPFVFVRIPLQRVRILPGIYMSSPDDHYENEDVWNTCLIWFIRHRYDSIFQWFSRYWFTQIQGRICVISVNWDFVMASDYQAGHLIFHLFYWGVQWYFPVSLSQLIYYRQDIHLSFLLSSHPYY